MKIKKMKLILYLLLLFVFSLLIIGTYFGTNSTLDAKAKITNNTNKNNKNQDDTNNLNTIDTTNKEAEEKDELPNNIVLPADSINSNINKQINYNYLERFDSKEYYDLFNVHNTSNISNSFNFESLKTKNEWSQYFSRINKNTEYKNDSWNHITDVNLIDVKRKDSNFFIIFSTLEKNNEYTLRYKYNNSQFLLNTSNVDGKIGFLIPNEHKNVLLINILKNNSIIKTFNDNAFVHFYDNGDDDLKAWEYDLSGNKISEINIDQNNNLNGKLTLVWPGRVGKSWNLNDLYGVFIVKNKTKIQKIFYSDQSIDSGEFEYRMNFVGEKIDGKLIDVVYNSDKTKSKIKLKSLREDQIISKLINQINNATDIKNNFLSIEEDNDKIVINFANNIENKRIKFLLKSLNYQYKYSKLFDTKFENGIEIINNQLFFLKKILPIELDEFIITNLSIDDEESNLTYLDKFVLKINQVNMLNLTKFIISKNEDGRLFAAININDDFNILKNKLIKVNFSVDMNKNFPDTSNKNFKEFSTKSIYIPWDKLHKFELNNLLDGLKYTLSSIEVLDINTLHKKNIIIKINDNFKKSFIQQRNYEKIKLNNFFNDQNIVPTDKMVENWLNNKEIENLEQNRTNTKNLLDLYLEVISRETKKWMNGISLPKPREYKFLNGEKMHVIQPRRNIMKSFVHIEENSSAYYDIDMNMFKNYKNHLDDSIIYISLHLDHYFMRIADYYPYMNQTSTVGIAIPIKELFENKKIENLDFKFSYFNNNVYLNEKLKNQIASDFNFTASLNNDIIKFVIKSRGQSKIFNFVKDHLLSNNQSIYINDFVFNYVYNGKNDIEFIDNDDPNFISLNNTNNEPNSIFLKGDINQLTSRYDKYNNFINPKNQKNSIRITSEKETNYKNYAEIKNRAFWIKGHGGTYNVFAKVKPNDDNDYRFYIFTNVHVIDEIDKNDISIENGYYTIKHNSFEKIYFPILPSDEKYKNDKTYPIYSDLQHNNDLVPILNKKAFNNLTDNDFKFQMIRNWNTIHTIASRKEDKYKNLNPYLFKQYDNLGNPRINEKIGKNFNFDVSILIWDLKFIFENFEHQYKENKQVYEYNNQIIDGNNKKAIDIMLDWKKIKPLKLSKYNKYIRKYSNLNYFLNTFPNAASWNEDSPTDDKSRYRSYLIGNPISVGTKEPFQFSGITSIGVSFTAIEIDTGQGSSGSAVYDYESNLAGIITSGYLSPQKNNTITKKDRIEHGSDFMLFDTESNSFIGQKDNYSDTSSFNQIVRRLSWLYPNEYHEFMEN
ncbi:hypothetical protein [Mycoplasma phocoenae]|uniref:Uncharacterized protein n=1 Tax=Mycoplasma phocoenae TaxID=754517 RepID=A0A858U541_9MOLU|nr:hypothetical protein [Mycoplasma phocoenae]QJG67171.1 hypothetical protein HGG69_02550 [Mycoplasma phocoenae]